MTFKLTPEQEAVADRIGKEYYAERASTAAAKQEYESELLRVRHSLDQLDKNFYRVVAGLTLSLGLSLSGVFGWLTGPVGYMITTLAGGSALLTGAWLADYNGKRRRLHQRHKILGESLAHLTELAEGEA